MSFSSSSTQRSSPGVPFSAWRGARFVAVAKRALPFPPRPPRATTSRASLSSSSPIRSPSGWDLTDGAGRDAHDDVGSAAAVRLAPGAAAAGRGAEVALALEVAEGRLAGLDDQDHVPAMAAISAVRTATWDVRLATEGAGAVAAGTTGDEDARAVSEAGHQGRSIRRVSIGAGVATDGDTPPGAVYR